jgi:hypothetical protein
MKFLTPIFLTLLTIQTVAATSDPADNLNTRLEKDTVSAVLEKDFPSPKLRSASSGARMAKPQMKPHTTKPQKILDSDPFFGKDVRDAPVAFGTTKTDDMRIAPGSVGSFSEKPMKLKVMDTKRASLDPEQKDTIFI